MPEKAELKLSAGLCQLMAEQLYHIPPEKVSVIFYYTGQVNQKPEILQTDDVVVRESIIDAVSSSSHAMLEKIIPGGLVREKDFPVWLAVPDTVCAGCRFKERCCS